MYWCIYIYMCSIYNDSTNKSASKIHQRCYWCPGRAHRKVSWEIRGESVGLHQMCGYFGSCMHRKNNGNNVVLVVLLYFVLGFVNNTDVYFLFWISSQSPSSIEFDSRCGLWPADSMVGMSEFKMIFDSRVYFGSVRHPYASLDSWHLSKAAFT